MKYLLGKKNNKKHDIDYNYKDKKINANIHIILKLSSLLFAFFFISAVFTVTASATSELDIYNYSSKKHETYTGTQVKVSLNGKQISKKKTPGIIVNNIALASYKDIFVKSDLNFDFVYDKPNKTVSLTKDSNELVMTIGSRKATYNGKSVNLPVAPVKIKYKDVGTTNILVPSRFVTETFGYKYTWHKDKSTAAITATIPTIEEDTIFSLSINHNTPFEYNGALCNATIDGKKVNLGQMPSIIIDNTTMVRAKRVFADSSIGAHYKYNKKNKTISLKKENINLEMEIGSPVAYLNGEPILLDEAPLIVTNKEVDTNYVMVPGRSTAILLGYDYVWDNPSRTSRITIKNIQKPKEEKPKDKDNENPPGPELGDDRIIIEEGTILQQWNATEDLYGYSSGNHDIKSDNNEQGFIHTVTRDFSNMKSNGATYMFYSTAPFGLVSSEVNDKTISIRANNMQANNNTYHMWESGDNYASNITTTYDYNDSSTLIELNIETNNFTYDLTLSEDKLYLYVTVYVNALSAMTIATNDNGDYITLTGIKSLDVDIYKKDGMIYLDLPYTKNGLGIQSVILSDSKYINMLYSTDLIDKTQILIASNQELDYYIAEEGKQFSVSFVPSSETVNPPKEPDSNIPFPETDIPIVKDGDKYNVFIPKAKGIGQKHISHKDNYYENRFSIILEGDQRAFYKNNPIFNNVATINDITVSLNKQNQTEILISTNRLQGYDIAIDDNYIYINVGEPRDIYKNIVVLDPGHGGPAPGAIYFNTKEKDLNLKILYELGEKYFNSNPSQLKVYYTRETDVDMTLSDRAKFPNKVGADLFVSLHMNAFTTASVNGTEVYYSSSNNSPNKAGLTSRKLATMLVDNLTSALGTNSRGAKASRYTVVHKNTVPSVLIELAFMSNKKEFDKLSNPVFQEKAVKNIYETLQQVFYLYPTGR